MKTKKMEKKGKECQTKKVSNKVENKLTLCELVEKTLNEGIELEPIMLKVECVEIDLTICELVKKILSKNNEQTFEAI